MKKEYVKRLTLSWNEKKTDYQVKYTLVKSWAMVGKISDAVALGRDGWFARNRAGETLGPVTSKTTGILGIIGSLAAGVGDLAAFGRGEDWQRQSLKHQFQIIIKNGIL